MKIKDVLEKDDAKLHQEMIDLRKQLYTLRTQGVTNKLEDPSKISKIRKDVARIQTVLTQRRHKAAETAAK